MTPAPEIPLPKSWPTLAKSALLHLVSMLSMATNFVAGRRLESEAPDERLVAELSIAHRKIALLEEELRIKDSFVARIKPHRRPHHLPTDRMAILILKAANHWSQAETARRFQLSIYTIIRWMARRNEQGDQALVQTQVPVNKFPEFIRDIVLQLKAIFPFLGKNRIADVLARAGLHLAETTVGRFLATNKNKPAGPAKITPAPKVGRSVTANYPNHVWSCDLTAFPISPGFWVPWPPFTLTQCWPFCWWIAVVIDHYSRKILGVGVFKSEPTSREVRQLLNRAIRKAGKTPKHIVTDQGTQFLAEEYKAWCKRRKIRYRYGAVGKHGSISVIERFMRTMKADCLRRIIVPFYNKLLEAELNAFVTWHNEHMPHQGLAGITPEEAWAGNKPANRNPRYEPRRNWPRKSRCATPQARVKGRRGQRLILVLDHLEGKSHLPIVRLERVAA